MKDPDPHGDANNYCDTNFATTPGQDEGYCTEIDILEADSTGPHTPLHSPLRAPSPGALSAHC